MPVNTVADPLSSYRLNEVLEAAAGPDAVETFIDPRDKNVEDEE